MTLQFPSTTATRTSTYTEDDRTAYLRTLERLTLLASHSPNLFASPLGPLYHQGKLFMLPRHVFFGENTAEEAWRIAIYSGFSGLDASLALGSLRALERLVLEPKLGESFNLVFHSFANPSGLMDGTAATRTGHQLLDQHWANSPTAELQLLERDARTMQYHGVILLRSDPQATELRGLLRGFSPGEPFLHAEPVKGTSKAGYLPFKFPVQWESHPEGYLARSGPLTLVDDLRVRPFEVTFVVPSNASVEWASQAVSSTLRVFLNNFRTAVSTGLNI
jgi:hypothetical protein